MYFTNCLSHNSHCSEKELFNITISEYMFFPLIFIIGCLSDMMHIVLRSRVYSSSPFLPLSISFLCTNLWRFGNMITTQFVYLYMGYSYHL